MGKGVSGIVAGWLFPGFLALSLALSSGCSGKSGGTDHPGEVRGTVSLDPGVPLWMTHGTLLVVVLMKGPTSPDYLPVARSVFVHPTFPVPFVITQKDVRLTGITLEGNVRLEARLSLESGSPLVESGEYGVPSPVYGTVGGPPLRLLISRPLPSSGVPAR